MAPGFAPIDQDLPCPCGGGLYQQCCGPFHQGLRKPARAEALMRSRYSAFVRSEIAYLLETHPEPAISPRERRRQLRSSCGPNQWRGLTILAVNAGETGDLEGTVQFEAQHRSGVLRETSLFQRRGGVLSGDWLYIRPLALEG